MSKFSSLFFIFSLIILSNCKKNYTPNTDESLLVNKNLNFSIKTIKGIIKIKLNFKKNPNTTKRIYDLISSNFYNNNKIFKIVPNYYVQFGDPTESGFGGSGKKIVNEQNNLPVVSGSLCLYRPNGLNSGDSQLIISMTNINNAQKKYLVIGSVINSIEILKTLSIGEKIIYIKKN